GCATRLDPRSTGVRLIIADCPVLPGTLAGLLVHAAVPVLQDRRAYQFRGEAVRVEVTTQPGPVPFGAEPLETGCLDAAGRRQVAVAAEKLLDFTVRRQVQALAQELHDQGWVQRNIG